MFNPRRQIPPHIRDQVITRDKRTCQYCGAKGLYNRRCTIDHIVPIVQGGTNEPDNLIVACPTCNHRKHSTPLAQYIEQRKNAIAKELEWLAKLEQRV